MKVTHEKFIEVWQAAETANDVVEKTGMKRSAVFSRASVLKKHGIDLKKLASATRHNYKALSELAEKLLNGKAKKDKKE